ncbi:MAG: sigma-70 family RNA polymerase sigma factor [Pirellulaceae bacterium]
MISAEAPELLAQLRAGGQHALAEAFTNHREQLARMVSRRLDPRLRPRVGASDILQQGFLDAARRLDDYLADPPMPFYLWLRFLVRQQLLAATRWHLGTKKRDARREQDAPRVDPKHSDASAVAFELSARLSSPSRVAARSELHEQLYAALENLSPLDREMIVLRHFDGLSNGEAAAELGLSVAAASKRYLRAIERLKTVADSVLASWQADN